MPRCSRWSCGGRGGRGAGSRRGVAARGRGAVVAVLAMERSRVCDARNGAIAVYGARDGAVKVHGD
eukprot:290497-Chlamydomonas_euryale.AAC.1